MADTTVAENGEVIRHLSPPEYVKRANARDARSRHDVDLHHFMGFLSVHPLRGAALSLGGEQELDRIIEDYLDETNPVSGT